MDVTQGLGNPEGLSIFIIFKTPDELAGDGGAILGTNSDVIMGNGWFNISTSSFVTVYYFFDAVDRGTYDGILTSEVYLKKSTSYILGIVNNANVVGSVYSGSNRSMRSSQLQQSTGATSPERPNFNNGLNNGYNNGNHLDGFISEIIIFDRALKNEERISVQNYLVKKWGIAIS